MANRAASLSNELLTAMQQARSEAIKRNTDITVCKSSEPTRCIGNWTDGWIMFSDVDRDRHLDRIDGDELVTVKQLGGIRFSIKWNGFRSDNYIQFSPLGHIHDNNGTFSLCPPDKDNRYARAIIVNRLGRARVSKDNDHDGIHEDSYGNPIDCS
jgi:type IV fimbrial biogenesis protein FimT